MYRLFGASHGCGRRLEGGHMDPTAAAAPTGFTAWILANGQIVLFFAQILFWIVLGFAAVWAAFVFNKLVKFTVGDDAPVRAMDSADKTVSVEEFVE
jgi:hypothetical protein